MKKVFLILFGVVLSFYLYGCNSDEPDQAVLSFDYGHNITATETDSSGILFDNDGNELGEFYLHVGTVTTDNDGVTRLVNNENYRLTIVLKPNISSENLKVFYNNTLLDLTSFDSEYHQYDFDFITGSTEHNIKIEGLTKA